MSEKDKKADVGVENTEQGGNSDGSAKGQEKKQGGKLKWIIPAVLVLILLAVFGAVKLKDSGSKNVYVKGNANNEAKPHITYVTSEEGVENSADPTGTGENGGNGDEKGGNDVSPAGTVTPAVTGKEEGGNGNTGNTGNGGTTGNGNGGGSGNAGGGSTSGGSTGTPTPKPVGNNGGGSTPSGTPVSAHGALSVKGTQLVDKNGNAFQLKGVSTHGLQWFPQYVNKAAFTSLRDEWGCNVVRLALYTYENGYCSGGNKTELKQLVNDGVSYATELGMYVIIDWHILNERDPNTYKSEAVAFFDEMSEKYASYDNVIYEICNEPNGVSWGQVKSYANEVIAAIRANDKDAIIIVGTPTWSQDVDQAAASPITGCSNIMYALHFYADTHTDWLRNRMVSAINAGLPVFVSEYGICDASGNGACNISQANSWIQTMDQYGVSYVCWNLANKNESSSLISSGVSKKSGWSYDELSTEGKWLVDTLGGSIAKYTSGAVKSTTGGTSGGNTTGGSTGGSSGGSTGGSGGATPTPKPTKAPQPTKTPTPKPTQAPSGSVSAKVDETNSWNDGTKTTYQFNYTVSNNSSADISGWTVTVTFSANVSDVSGWNADYSVSGKTLTIKSMQEDWAKNIAKNNSFSAGFSILGPDNLSVTSVKISY